ncbi:hypothetical protein JTE90_004086 [Oedothorax gibbosus]|uniref:Caspase-8 n=1 Tax=Oedothorax gibbosus TaxID=931172 RepID=A0AAV6TPU9_9ARAC|nr:hypothetical protein JTE90_004086 [Oedothorax gibbosus]
MSDKKPVKYLGTENNEYYPMKGYKKKGLCCIFNHKNFDDHKWQYLEQRKGTDVDAQQLKDLFQVKLGFDVEEFKDYTYNQIDETLQTVQKLHESEYSSFVCCILSYGRKKWLCDSNFVYEAENIYQGFFRDKCKAFAGKPKIFFIQACPCDVDVPSDESTDDGDSNESIFRIPTTSGFEVVDSTMGNLAWNSNSAKGSWFIEDLCSTIENHISEMNLLQILNLVSNKLSERHQGKRLTVEVPCVTSTLIRDIEFLDRDSRGSEIQRYELVSNGKLKKGKVLIFNHELYKDDRLVPREGTDYDVKCLRSLFPMSDFKLCRFKDKTKEFIFQKLHKAAKSHKRYGCFICCILTHGNPDKLSAFDEDYEISELLSCFHNKWRGKPKVFLLQNMFLYNYKLVTISAEYIFK